MAEGAQAPPTFKLVLVGDGGTGKASKMDSPVFYCFQTITHKCRQLSPDLSASPPRNQEIALSIAIPCQQDHIINA